MFWDIVINGLKVLLHWQTYVITIMYLIISFLPNVLIVMFTGNKNKSISDELIMIELMTKGGYLAKLIQPLLQALAIFISVCTLFPIMLGGLEAAWSLPWMLIINAPGKILILLILLVVLSIVTTSIPLIDSTNPFLTFMMGSIVLAFLIKLIIGNIDIFPDFVTIIGIVIVLGVTSLLGILASIRIADSFTRRQKGIGLLTMLPLASVFGFIPLFIYGAWIGLQIKN